MAAASKMESMASLEAKVHAYCEVSPEARTMEGLAAYATQLRQEGDLNTLRALSREIDTWLREIHTEDQQSVVAGHMLACGVLQQHLPPSVGRMLQRLIRRGRLAGEAEAMFVKEVLANPFLVAKYEGDISALQSMLAPRVVKS
jgi:hypothetical protein